ncbi:UNC93-like protein [Bicyclus anynana]|uniref:UNC93-like protein n=1 Tax=Bicyclus anynana TaxID=110368 RepID=A0A6J1N0Q5_BICAN|nr:UNC93-like protein [Bicyclus anynana]XP_023941437.2 UNC93-like protein [Bicyclus anynana]XP_052741409.1 UNC93-like protein [Bicyclus anynana]XP_052741410.1 UNC93-like protein [Bicyclus anynana]
MTKELNELDFKAKEMKDVDLKLKKTMDTKEIDLKPKETWRIVKNVVIISLAFMVHFTAYCGAANLQSSINAEAGLGTASLAAVYAGLIFSNIFLPVFVIKWLGTKWAISLSFITYMPYIAAQMYPRFYTLIPAGLIVGLGGGPLWCAKCTYLSVVSEAHSKISGISAEALLVRFLGLFFMIFQLNQVWGNLISSLVISSGDNLAAVTAVNATMIPKLCGANFLPSADAAEALQPQPPEKIQMIAGIYLACMAGAALIVAVGVDSMKRYQAGRKDTGSGLSGLALLVVTLQLLIEPNQLMLVIINIFVGMQQAFFGADFTAAFVSCAVGTGMVGFVMMTFGIADAIGCLVTGYISKLTGRLPLIIVATVAHFGLFVALLAWRPQHDQSHIMFIIAILWGLCDSIWIVQINAYYGILFPGREEAAFSNFRLWESVGYIIAYIISPHLRTSAKTYVLMGSMIVGVTFYFIVEYRDRKSKRVLEITPADKYVGGLDNKAYSD